MWTTIIAMLHQGHSSATKMDQSAEARHVTRDTGEGGKLSQLQDRR